MSHNESLIKHRNLLSDVLISSPPSEAYSFPEKLTYISRNDSLEIKISKRLSIALLASVVFHLAFLFTRFVLIPEPPIQPEPITIDVALAPPSKPSQALPPPPAIPEPLKPAPKTETKSERKQPKIMAVPKPNGSTHATIRQESITDNTPVPPVPTPPNPPTPAPVEIPPGMDMMAYVNAARARRRSVGDAGQLNEDAQNKQRAPTRDEIRNEIIAKNLKAEGQNGLFTILSKDERYARFSYRGWTSDYASARQEIIDVDAGPNGNIEDAIITRMIQIIRQHYQEDFNWHSQRLGRVIVLSARQEDTEGLKDFLKRELFNIKPAQIPY